MIYLYVQTLERNKPNVFHLLQLNGFFVFVFIGALTIASDVRTWRWLYQLLRQPLAVLLGDDTDRLAGAALSPAHPSDFWQSAFSRFPELEGARTVCCTETQSGAEYVCQGRGPCGPTQIHSSDTPYRRRHKEVCGWVTSGASGTASTPVLCEGSWSMSLFLFHLYKRWLPLWAVLGCVACSYHYLAAKRQQEEN